MKERITKPQRLVKLHPECRSAKKILESRCGNFAVGGSLMAMRNGYPGSYLFPVQIDGYIYNVDQDTYFDI